MKQKLNTLFDNITALIYAVYIALASCVLVMSSASPFNTPRPWQMNFIHEVPDCMETKGMKLWWNKGKLKTRFK